MKKSRCVLWARKYGKLPFVVEDKCQSLSRPFYFEPLLFWLKWIFTKYKSSDILVKKNVKMSTGTGLIYWELWELDEGDCRNGAFLSEEAQCGEPLGRAVEDVLTKTLDMGISLHMGPHLGTWRGFACWDFWEKRIVYVGSFLGLGGH